MDDCRDTADHAGERELSSGGESTTTEDCSDATDDRGNTADDSGDAADHAGQGELSAGRESDTGQRQAERVSLSLIHI